MVGPKNLIQALDPKGCEEVKISGSPVIDNQSINELQWVVREN
jgi:hypothetical protein